jgi:hypothetical protein
MALATAPQLLKQQPTAMAPEKFDVLPIQKTPLHVYRTVRTGLPEVRWRLLNKGLQQTNPILGQMPWKNT